MAGGNNIATYSGDATHHLYLANNVYRQAYGNDRGETTPFLRHLYIKMHYFTKTGSGQT